jgi:hypothetical protein
MGIVTVGLGLMSLIDVSVSVILSGGKGHGEAPGRHGPDVLSWVCTRSPSCGGDRLDHHAISEAMAHHHGHSEAWPVMAVIGVLWVWVLWWEGELW